MTHPVATTLLTIEAELNARFFERQSAVRAMLLAVLAKQHVYIKGPPGTGKSNMVRDLIRRFLGATDFEAALSKTRPAEAIIGPLDMAGIKNSQFIRKGEGFLQSVDFAFLDEIGKMSSVLGHDLLALLNERLLHEVNHGRSAHKVPLSTAFTASNEPIVNESDDAAALYDRLLVRCLVDYIQEASNFAKLVGRGAIDTSTDTTLDYADLKDVIENVIPSIDFTTEAVEAVLMLKAQMKLAGLVVSDRRWNDSRKIMRAAAFLDGRDEVTADDVEALEYTLWESEDQISKIRTLTYSASSPLAAELIVLMDQLNEIRNGITALEGRSTQDLSAYSTEASPKMARVKRGIKALRERCLDEDRSTKKVDDVQSMHDEVMVDIYTKCLGMEESTARNRTGAAA